MFHGLLYTGTIYLFSPEDIFFSLLSDREEGRERNFNVREKQPTELHWPGSLVLFILML